MQAGTLRHRLTIQKKTVVRSGYGEETVTWADQATVWAAIWPGSGKEYFAAEQLQTKRIGRIRIRHRKYLTEENRFKFGNNRYFNIEMIINKDERDNFLDIFYSERSYEARS